MYRALSAGKKYTTSCSLVASMIVVGSPETVAVSLGPRPHQESDIAINPEARRHPVERLHPLHEHCTGELRYKKRWKNTQG